MVVLWCLLFSKIKLGIHSVRPQGRLVRFNNMLFEGVCNYESLLSGVVVATAEVAVATTGRLSSNGIKGSRITFNSS